MSVLIAYASKTGTTAKAVARLKEALPDATVADLKKETPDLAAYDTILVGGPIRAGSLHKSVKKFCQAQESVLLSKTLGLFICCGFSENSQKQLERNFSEPLRNQATAVMNFGGELNLEKLKGPEKFMIKTIINEPDYVPPCLSEENIDAFATFFQQ